MLLTPFDLLISSQSSCVIILPVGKKTIDPEYLASLRSQMIWVYTFFRRGYRIWKSYAHVKLLYTVKPVLSSHSEIDKTKILMTNGSLMNIESTAECSPRGIMKVKSTAECSPWSIMKVESTAKCSPWSIMKVKSTAECPPWSILQYFWPALSNENQFFVFFQSGRFRQVLL